jgi:vancomycin resistance protein YoaR
MATLDAAPRLNPWLIRLPILFISGVVLLAVLLLGFVGVVQGMYRDAIVPGVWANGVDLGGLSRAQAEMALADAFTYGDQAVFTFRDGDQFWQFNASELGVQFDLEATLDAAFGAGRSSLFEQASVWFNGRTVAPVVKYDQNAALEKLLTIADVVNQPALEGTLRIDGTSVTATSGSVGRSLDIPAMLAQLDNAILRLDTGAEIALVIQETPPLMANTESAAAQAQAAISSPITLEASDASGWILGPWTASTDQIATLLRVEPTYNDDGTISYSVGIHVDAFRAFLESIASGLRSEAQDARYHFNEETRGLEVFEPAVNGRAINIDETLRRVEAAIFNPDPNARRVAIAFDAVLPRYHAGVTAAELGITELVAEATTYYTGSTQGRIANIIEGTTRFDGVLIAPGEEFSFNTLVGEITAEEGFAEGLIIYGDDTIKGVGGGICQVSTTAYQAAFFAGYPITERHSHAYRVRYYEQGEGVGMDAAIYQGDPALGESSLDFRFVNDTPHHLLIETSIFPADQSVQFRFYSTNPGRTVVKEGPSLSDLVAAKPTLYQANPDIPLNQERWVDWPAEGGYVTVTRVLLDANGQEINRQNFNTRYAPWGAVIQVNPQDTRLSAASPVNG